MTVLFFLSGLLAAQEEEELIPWRADRKLQWSDFKGDYFKTEYAAATTATSISYAFSSFEKEGRMQIDFEVRCEFYPNKSWYRPELCDSLILSHEQLHFDIAELYARKMRKRLADSKFTKNIKAEVKQIYKAILKELYIFQNKYDRETNFSRNYKEQLFWNKKIAAALQTDQ